MYKFLKLEDNHLYFSFNDHVYCFFLHKTNSTYYSVDSILHSSTEKCPECGEGAPTDLVCEVLTKENRSILLKLLESPNLRLLQETGQLFQRNNFFLSDVAENMLTGLEKEVFEMYHLEGMNMASIAIHLDLTLSQTLQIYNEATSKL